MKGYIRVYTPEGVSTERCGTLSLEQLQDKVGGWIEVHAVGDLSYVCDEEGLIKGLRPSVSVAGTRLVGTVLVGKFDGSGLSGVSRTDLSTFERTYHALPLHVLRQKR